jgi:hypothetical protein
LIKHKILGELNKEKITYTLISLVLKNYKDKEVAYKVKMYRHFY